MSHGDPEWDTRIRYNLFPAIGRADFEIHINVEAGSVALHVASTQGFSLITRTSNAESCGWCRLRSPGEVC